jgi:hypothetical protein
MPDFLLVSHPYPPKINLKRKKSQGIGESLIKVLLAANRNTKLYILLPKMQFEFVFMHSLVPQPQNSFNDYVSQHVLAKSALDSFL